jgi:hypothetical protein
MMDAALMQLFGDSLFLEASKYEAYRAMFWRHFLRFSTGHGITENGFNIDM